MDVDAGSGDRLALTVLAQYRMAATEQMHQILSPWGADRADPASAGPRPDDSGPRRCQTWAVWIMP